MPFTFTMPKLSPTMEEGTITRWLKKEGEFVEAGEALLEIATDKATVEHEALDEGWLRKILIPEGGEATVNQPIAVFTVEKEESIEGFGVEKKKEKVPAAEKKEEVAAAAPAPVKKGAAMEQPAFVPEEPLTDYTFEPPVEALSERLRASPLARHLAQKRGLDISTVKGSGPGGRVTARDLEMAQPEGLVSFGHREAPKIAPGTYEEEKLSPMRKAIARRLQESKSFIPHFYVKQVIDASNLVRLREQLKEMEMRITFNDMVVRACALALRKHPEINAGFNTVKQTIVRFKTIDVSVAVTFEAGLITPIIRHTDYKNLGEISVEMRALAEKARAGKLAEREYKGGSFCVSNLGMFGVTEFSAVINPPQAAILAVGGIEEVPVVKGGRVVPGKTLTVVLSVDHRVIDGADAARFLKTLQHLLENPASLTI